MKRPLKYTTLVIGASLCLLAGAGVSNVLGVQDVRTQSKGGAESKGEMVVTGSLSVPGQGGTITRMEDRESGVICYFAKSGSFSCTRK